MKLSKVPKKLVKIWRKQYEQFILYTTSDVTWVRWLNEKYDIDIE